MWYRVFGTTPTPIEPAALLAHLHARGHAARGDFRGDEQGWFHVELTAADTAVEVQRYLASEEGIRDELNAWAAAIEQIDTPHQSALMLHMISTQQLFTLRPLRGTSDGALCRELCGWLAQQTEGVWHEDGRGFFDAAGEPLARDEA